MKTVTICGSMNFAAEMKQIAFELESQRGYVVLQCVYPERDADITPGMLENLKRSHLQKIQMSDGIYVVNVDGYLGDSVKREIRFAESRHKEIEYLIPKQGTGDCREGERYGGE